MPQKGERLGRYFLGDKLGEGKFGCVFEGWDEELERTVALKAPQLNRNTTASTVDKFCHEMKSLAGLQHPNVLVIHDILRDPNGWPWMVLDHCAGGPIDLAVGTVDFNDFVAIAEGLDYVHQQGIIHRDLKPANVLKHANGRTVIADFGLSLHRERQELSEGETAGTLYYMSPEQVLGESHWMDGRADIWAVGVMLYEALCGEKPFDADSRIKISEQILSKPARPPRQLLSSASARLEAVCLKCLRKSPDDRYATAGDLAADLKRALGTSPKRSAPGKTLIAASGVAMVAFAFIYQGILGKKSVDDRAASPAKRVLTVEKPVVQPQISSALVRGSNVVAAQRPVSSSFESSFDTWVGTGQSVIEFSDDPFEGKRSVRVTNRTRDIDGLLVDISDQIRPQRRYFVSGHVKSDAEDVEVLLQMSTVSSDQKRHDTIGIVQPKGSWTPIDGSFVFDRKPTSVMLRFRCLDNATDDLLVDSVDIVEVEPCGKVSLRIMVLSAERIRGKH